MSATPLISLIIVSYNSERSLSALFQSLAATRYPSYDVLVVDNASSDGSVQSVREHAPQAGIIANRSNEGFGRACNRGAAATGGELLVFMNPDLLVAPNWLDSLVACMVAAPDAAIVTPETLPFSMFPTTPAHSHTQPFSETAAVPGCAMMMRRTAWAQLGGFDQQIFLYWEDTELCWRAWLLGWRVLVAHNAFVFHERGGSGGGKAWALEATTNGLYTHLKLMRWRRILPYMLLLALKTVRRPALYQAWQRNLHGLGRTMAERRSIGAQRVIEPARLEALIDLHRAKNKRGSIKAES